MRSKFALAGHPLHPMLVTLPIGLFVWTLVADFIFLGTNEVVWFEIARWSSVAAIASALVAAIPGLGDYLGLGFTGNARRTATTHMLLNVLVLAVYIVAAVIMFGGLQALEEGVISPNWAMVVTGLHALGAVLLAASGWLGGELVYRHRLGVMTEAASGVDGSGARETDATEQQRMDRERAREVTERQRRERTTD